MSLERQDVRAKLDADMYEALAAILDAKGLSQSEFIESLLVPEIKRLVHEANVIADRLRDPGGTARSREKPREAGKQRTWTLTNSAGERTEFSEKTRG